jgi:transcription-repair coupling factor
LKFTAQMENVEERIKAVKSVLKTLKERVVAK